MTLLDILLGALAVGVLVYAAVVPKHRKAAIGVFAGALALLGIDVLLRKRKGDAERTAGAAKAAADDARARREAAKATHSAANDDEWETAKAARKDADDAVPPRKAADPDDVAGRFNRRPK